MLAMYVDCFWFFGFFGGLFCRLGSFRLFLGWIFSVHFRCFLLSVVFVSFFVFVLSSVLWFSSFGVVCVCVPGFSGFCLLRVWMGLVLLLSGCVFVDVLCRGVLLFWMLAGRTPSMLSC